MDPRVTKLAELLLDYSVEVREGQTVMLRAATVAEPLVQALIKASAERGVHLLPLLGVDDGQYLFFKNATDDLLHEVNPLDVKLFESADALIGLHATSNPRELSKIDPNRMAIRQKATQIIYEIVNRREMAGSFKWVGAPYPTAGMAADAEMSLCEYSDFVYRACACEDENPAAHWLKVHEEQEEIVKAFNGAKTLHIEGLETDLSLSVAGRTWINCDGKKNMPDGEIFTSPVEDSAQGSIYFDYPAVFRGVEVMGVRLTLKEGKVIEASAEKNEDYLIKMLDSDEFARFVGEIAIGTNFNIQSPSKSILFDEKIGGSMHMAVGMSIPETGGKNKSGLHWDMIKNMKQGGRWILDGKCVYEDGKFRI